MAEAALNELQQQIDAIRREGFADGYAAAMKAVCELASRTAPQSDRGAAAPSANASPNESEPRRAASPLRTSTAVRRSPAERPAGAVGRITRRPRRRRAQRGTN